MHLDRKYFEEDILEKLKNILKKNWYQNIPIFLITYVNLYIYIFIYMINLNRESEIFY